MSRPAPCFRGAVVVGAGPAGVRCALDLHRAGCDVLLVGDEHPEERAAAFPDSRSCTFLSDSVALRHAREAAFSVLPSGLGFMLAEVTAVEWDHPLYVVATSAGVVRARAVVLATGTDAEGRPRLPGTESLGLDACEAGFLVTDGGYCTSNLRLHAVGDLVSGMRASVSCASGTGSKAARAIGRSLAEA